MADEHTTAVVQHYLDALAGDLPSEPIVRALLERAVRRLQLLCTNLLYRNYPRLTLPPTNLEPDELLGAVVERLLKALRQARPQTVRQFFALANQHMRWELNDLARRLDDRSAVELREAIVPAPAESSASSLSTNTRRMLEAIEDLPEDEREVFSLVRIQGMTQTEAADVLGISPKTVQRRLHRSLVLLTGKLGDLQGAERDTTRLKVDATICPGTTHVSTGSVGHVRRSAHPATARRNPGVQWHARGRVPGMPGAVARRSTSGWEQLQCVEAQVDALFPTTEPARSEHSADAFGDRAAANPWLRSAGVLGPRRHGRRLQGPSPEAESHGGDQDVARRRPCGSAATEAIHARGGDGGGPATPAHRAGLRCRRPRRTPVLHHGVCRRRESGTEAGGGAAAGRPVRGAGDHTGRGRAPGPSRRDRAPRSEAREHSPHG